MRTFRTEISIIIDIHKLPVQHARVVAVGEGALLSSGKKSVKIDE